MKKVVIFSHGFGVDQYSNGFFTDIIDALPESVIPIHFPYNIHDAVQNTMYINPFSVQLEILKNQIKHVRSVYPDTELSIIAHSQGCSITSLLGTDSLKSVQKILLLAPPVTMSTRRLEKRCEERMGHSINFEEQTLLARSDGSTSIIPPKYWRERKAMQSPIPLYEKLNSLVSLNIVLAGQDEILETEPLEQNSVLAITTLDGDHNFTGKDRRQLLEYIENWL